MAAGRWVVNRGRSTGGMIITGRRQRRNGVVGEGDPFLAHRREGANGELFSNIVMKL